MTRATKIGLGVVAGIIVLAVGFGAVSLFNNSANHNWSLGLAPQKSSADVAKVQAAVESVQNDAVLDVYVKNANTTGTPFGHSMRINVLVDADMITGTDEEAIQKLVADITKAVQQTGVQDTYDLYVGLDVNVRATSGSGTPEQPATSAERMFGADIVYDSSFES